VTYLAVEDAQPWIWLCLLPAPSQRSPPPGASRRLHGVDCYVHDFVRPNVNARIRDSGRVGGAVALVVSAMWALAGAGTVVFGLIHWAEGDAVGGFWGGWVDLLGATIVAIGVAVLTAAVIGSVLGIRLMRGQETVRPAVYFGLIAAVSAVITLLDLFGRQGPNRRCSCRCSASPLASW
jgi:hypothetical protein